MADQRIKPGPIITKSNNPNIHQIMKTTTLKNAFLAAMLAFGTVTAQAQVYPTAIGSATTNANPYFYAGKLSMTFRTSSGLEQNYVGTATTIKPYSALTAGHCVYDSSMGWMRRATFERARYYSTSASRNTVTRAWVIGGYTSNAGSDGSNSYTGFSYDAGAVVCSTRPGGGGYAGWSTNTSLLTGTAYNMSLGYGAEYHNGLEMLRSAPTRGFTRGTGAFYTNTSYRIEGGMSGGPVFARSGTTWYVCAINVAGTGLLAGVRALDSATTGLIQNNLQ